jgi:hypothetical protein
MTGGVHGLERIGAELCLNLLKSTIENLTWDKSLQHLFTQIRVVFVPLVNPAGYYNFTRCNSNGVDLMRNGPVDATDKVPFLLGGHRISPLLPWYRGKENVIESENSALFKKFNEECGKSEAVVSLDFHSGFGLQDRLWFPYSKMRKPFEDLPEAVALFDLFETTHPYHIYQIEPQSHAYLLNGDIWDHMYTEFKKMNSHPYIPITLEMGSWNWVKKNPLQLISKQGLFNPIKDHRVKRTYRRHLLLFNFILKALFSYSTWATLSPLVREKKFEAALRRWYEL